MCPRKSTGMKTKAYNFMTREFVVFSPFLFRVTPTNMIRFTRSLNSCRESNFALKCSKQKENQSIGSGEMRLRKLIEIKTIALSLNSGFC